MATIGSCGLPASTCTPTPMERGIVLFNSRLKAGSKKRIGPTLASNHQHLPCTLDDLLKDAVKLRDQHLNKRSVRQVRIEHVISNINRHAKVIDVLIQQQPDITALVWGSFRFLVGVAAIELDTSEKISETLVQVTDSLGCWNKYVELFDEFERVRDAAACLFSHIIDLLVRARIYYQKCRAIRYFKLGFTTYSQKFEDIMSLIHKNEDLLEREASLASKIKFEQDRKTRDEQFALERQQFEKQNEFRNESLHNSKKIQDLLQRDSLHREATKVHEWLRQTQYPPFLIPEEEKGTCTWITQSDAWLTWANSNYNKPLGISGVPGSGKSTIANYLTKYFRTTIVISHFFQATINRDQARPAPFAAAVLYHLLQQDAVKSCSSYPLAIEQGNALSQTLDMAGEMAFRQLWRIVLSLTSNIPSFTLIVDGVDECDAKYRVELSLSLLSLASKPNTRIVVLFRPHPCLEKSFHDCPRVELNPTSISKDVELYIFAEVQRYPKKLWRLRDEILQTIPHTCQGMFLYAEMILTSLKDADTHSEQLMCLQQAPSSLYEFYEKLISSRNRPLTQSSLIRRREIFVILVGVCEALTCEELSIVLSLRADGRAQVGEVDELLEPEETVLSLCWPLVRISNNRVCLMHGTVKEFLTQPSLDYKCPIKITSDESEAYLASKSLVALSRDKYRSLNRIAILVRRNVASETEADEDEYFYKYAATHWYIHLTAIRKPELSLIQQAARFLYGNEFVSWSEFLFQISGSQGTVLEVESKLKIWKKSLSDGLGDHLSLVDYFSGPYRASAKAFEDDAGDKTLQYLCLFQLGEYYNLAARIEEAFQVKQTVSEGLVCLLGERHPLALRAQSAFALEYLGQQRFPEAEMKFDRLAQIQKEVLGVDRPDCFQSRQRQAMAELWMTKFTDADINLTESLSGFFDTVGVKSFLYLMSQLASGQVLEYQGQVDRATLDYEHIWRYRSSVLGPDNPMAVWARCALVSTYRKLGRYGDAHKAISEVIDARNRTMGPKSSLTVDAMIQQAVLYLDDEKFEEAIEVVDFILDGGLVDEWFERLVQVDHVRALLELFTGNIESAIRIFQSLVDRSLEIGEDGRVRSLLWVRLDLATIFRREGRSDEALKLFDNFVTSTDCDSSCSWEDLGISPELTIAEKALRLIRDIKLRDADLLLENSGLKWVRQKDFWILNGSPPADTAWMKKP